MTPALDIIEKLQKTLVTIVFWSAPVRFKVWLDLGKIPSGTYMISCMKFLPFYLFFIPNIRQ